VAGVGNGSAAGLVTPAKPGSTVISALIVDEPNAGQTCGDPPSCGDLYNQLEGQAPGQVLAVPNVTVYTAGNVTYGNTPLISASVTDNGGQGPTGTVTFSMTPAHGVAPATVNLVAGAAKWSLGNTLIDVGPYDVSASYSGDSKYAATVGSGAFAIGEAESLSTISNCPSTVTAGTAYSFDVTVDWAAPPPDAARPPTGKVILTASPNPGTLAQNSGTLASGMVTIPITLQAGKYVVTAAYQGDTNYNTHTSDTCAVTAQ
jgi:hypothetical protein